MKTTEICERIAAPIIADLGYELVDVEFVKENGQWVLTFFIDKPGGVDIDDCERVSRAVEPVLDERDPIEPFYYLSVSSPGIDRPLKKQRDYEKRMGAEVSVKLYAPQDKKKEFTGILQSADESTFTLKLLNGEEKVFQKKDAALVRPVIKF
ncbi:MAG: ribosome maturation factor RimP [Clostridiales bacterium]|nr:ribosome maturation factor RimP [Clostridiales bacterium]